MITLVDARKDVERLVAVVQVMLLEVPLNPRRKNVLEKQLMRHIPWVIVMLVLNIFFWLYCVSAKV
jgi:hypothetical protein